MRQYEDSDYRIFHNCPNKKNHTTQDDDRLLLMKTITRVSQVEIKLEQIKDVLDKNGLYVQSR